MSTLFWQADPFRICGTESDNGLKRFAAEVRLIPEDNCPMSEICSPAGPLCGALNRTKHATIRRSIEDTIVCRKAEAIEFGLDKQVIRRAHDCDLFGLESLPLVDQM